jgi:hypothetical protein
MKSTVTPKEFHLFNELRRGGIPIDETLWKERKAAFRGLVVHQSGCVLDNAIYDQGSGETCFVLSVAVTNRSDRSIRFQA